MSKRRLAVLAMGLCAALTLAACATAATSPLQPPIVSISSASEPTLETARIRAEQLRARMETALERALQEVRARMVRTIQVAERSAELQEQLTELQQRQSAELQEQFAELEEQLTQLQPLGQ